MNVLNALVKKKRKKMERLNRLEEDIEEVDNVLKNIKGSELYDVDKIISNGKKLIISDLDECLVNITPKWILIGKELGIFSPEITSEDIFNRKHYYISDFIDWERIKGHIKDKSIKNKDDLAKIIYNQKGFYDDLAPTKLGIALSRFLDNKLIDLVIISHHSCEKSRDSKIDFIKKYFPSCQYYIINTNQRKSWIVNGQKLNDYTTFIDDSLINIYDMIVNSNSVGKEFIIPKYGYNDVFYIDENNKAEDKNPTKLDIDMLDMIDSVGCSINYLDPL